MTNDQFEKYKKLQGDLKPVKDFLFWCGKKHHSEFIMGVYQFALVTKFRSILLEKKDYPCVGERYEIPFDLQLRIVDVVEQWADEKEKELEEI